MKSLDEIFTGVSHEFYMVYSLIRNKLVCMDALTHAIKGFITKGAWDMSNIFHIKAIEIIEKFLRGSVAGNQEERDAMAHPLSAWYNTPIGGTCATLLPLIKDFNKVNIGEKYRGITIKC